MVDLDTYNKVSRMIIKNQESILGPLAWDQARKVAGLKIDSNGSVLVNGDGKEVLGELVAQYEHLFGKASVEVCREALKEVNINIDPSDLPDILK